MRLPPSLQAAERPEWDGEASPPRAKPPHHRIAVAAVSRGVSIGGELNLWDLARRDFGAARGELVSAFQVFVSSMFYYRTFFETSHFRLALCLGPQFERIYRVGVSLRREPKRGLR